MKTVLITGANIRAFSMVEKDGGTTDTFECAYWRVYAAGNVFLGCCKQGFGLRNGVRHSLPLFMPAIQAGRYW